MSAPSPAHHLTARLLQALDTDYNVSHPLPRPTSPRPYPYPYPYPTPSTAAAALTPSLLSVTRDTAAYRASACRGAPRDSAPAAPPPAFPRPSI